MKDIKWTLVRHSAWTAVGDRNFEHAVEERLLTSSRDISKVMKVGGVLFEDYRQADQACMQENYAGINGMIPRVKGSFAKAKIEGQEIYVPPIQV